MLPIDSSPNLQKLKCLEIGVVNGQDLNAAPFPALVNLGRDPWIYLDLHFWLGCSFLLSLIQMLTPFCYQLGIT
jgi:hypothetical protein